MNGRGSQIDNTVQILKHAFDTQKFSSRDCHAIPFV